MVARYSVEFEHWPWRLVAAVEPTLNDDRKLRVSSELFNANDGCLDPLSIQLKGIIGRRENILMPDIQTLLMDIFGPLPMT